MTSCSTVILGSHEYIDYMSEVGHPVTTTPHFPISQNVLSFTDK